MQNKSRFSIGFLLLFLSAAFLVMPCSAVCESKSYTKLDIAGQPVPCDSINFAMIRDNDTGLIWAAKTDDDTLHDRDNQIFSLPLHAHGYTDWRLPSVDELVSIVDYENPSGPGTSSEEYFPMTQLDYYIAQDPGNPGVPAYLVHFGTGDVIRLGSGAPQEPVNMYWRAVRSDQPVIGPRYRAPAPMTLIDAATGLMWMIDPAQAPLSAPDAVQHCQQLTYLSFRDWRAPTAGELATLMPYFENNPAQIDSWSSSGPADGSSWLADYGTGAILSLPEEERHRIFAVRGKTDNVKTLAGIYTSTRFSVGNVQESMYKMAGVEDNNDQAFLVLPQDMISPQSYCDFWGCFYDPIHIPFHIESTGSTGTAGIDVHLDDIAMMAADEICWSRSGGGIYSGCNYNMMSAEITDIEVWKTQLYIAGNVGLEIDSFDRTMAEDMLMLLCDEYQMYQSCLMDPPGSDPMNCQGDLTENQILTLESICQYPDWYMYSDLEIRDMLLQAGVSQDDIDNMSFYQMVNIPFIQQVDVSITEDGSQIDIGSSSPAYFPFYEQDPLIGNVDSLSGRVNAIKPIHTETLIMNADTDMDIEKSYIFHMMGSPAQQLPFDIGTGAGPEEDAPFITEPGQWDELTYYEIGRDSSGMSSASLTSFSFAYGSYSDENQFDLQKEFERTSANTDSFFTLEYFIPTFGDPFYIFGVLPLEELKNYHFAHTGTYSLYDHYILDMAATEDHAFVFGETQVFGESRGIIQKMDVSDPKSLQMTETVMHGDLDSFFHDANYIGPFAPLDNKFIFAASTFHPSVGTSVEFRVLEKASEPLEAEAGPFASVYEHAAVILKGSIPFLSGDPAGCSYQWQQLSGPTVLLDDPAVPSPRFTAPQAGIFGEWLRFRLTVFDSLGNQSQDTVCIYVMDQGGYDDNGDGDVDGLDLQAFIVNQPSGSLDGFAGAFGAAQ